MFYHKNLLFYHKKLKFWYKKIKYFHKNSSIKYYRSRKSKCQYDLGTKLFWKKYLLAQVSFSYETQMRFSSSIFMRSPWDHLEISLRSQGNLKEISAWESASFGYRISMRFSKKFSQGFSQSFSHSFFKVMRSSWLVLLKFIILFKKVSIYKNLNFLSNFIW